MGVRIRPALVLIIFLMLLHPAGARDGDGMRVVPAREIMDTIWRGEPVEYDHVIVEGDLDLGRLYLLKSLHETEYPGLSEITLLVPSYIRINDSTISGDVSFNAILSNQVNFRGSYFNGDANFMGSAFNDVADFGNSTFNGDAIFGNSAFNGDAIFGNSAFNGDAIFGNSAFNGDANFWNSAFNGYANFWNSTFKRYAKFVGSAFNGDADFMYSAFNGNADFMYSAFNGRVGFVGSAFNGDADFWDSAFNGDAYFGRSAFNADANFWNSAFNGTTDFSGSAFNFCDFSSAEFRKPVYFNDANFSKSARFNSSRFKEDALFEGALFDGPLYLPRAKYDRLYIRWNSIKELGYDDAAYLTLLENFKKLGYVEDYDACYYEYRRLHRDQDWSGKYHAMNPWEEWLRKRIDLGLDAFYGYGKKPIWPLLWSAASILLFGLIWRKAGVNGGRCRGGIFERFGPQSRKLSPGEQLRALVGAMLFSATLFLSGTRLFVDPPALPKLEGWIAAHSRGFFIAERVLGAFFSILFFLAISGTVVR